MKPTYCIIDEDPAAAGELGAILENIDKGKKLVCAAADVPKALETLAETLVDVLFIRIDAWDDYRKVAPLLPRLANAVVFLSGRSEKCTRHLPLVLDFWLQAPYRESRVRQVLERVHDKRLARRSLQLFFLRERCRYHPVEENDLLSVRTAGASLVVLTKTHRYQIGGSLKAFEERLSFPMQRVARGFSVPNRAGI